MGYMLSQLAHLPVDDEVTLYIFVIDYPFPNTRGESLKRNFPEIAQRIGSHAVIAIGLNEGWQEEVIQRVMDRPSQEMEKLFPALLLTDSHPEQVRPDTMKLLIPLEGAEKRFGGLEVFFNELARFARDRNPDFLKDLRTKAN